MALAMHTRLLNDADEIYTVIHDEPLRFQLGTVPEGVRCLVLRGPDHNLRFVNSEEIANGEGDVPAGYRLVPIED